MVPPSEMASDLGFNSHAGRAEAKLHRFNCDHFVGLTS